MDTTKAPLGNSSPKYSASVNQLLHASYYLDFLAVKLSPQGFFEHMKHICHLLDVSSEQTRREVWLEMARKSQGDDSHEQHLVGSVSSLPLTCFFSPMIDALLHSYQEPKSKQTMENLRLSLMTVFSEQPRLFESLLLAPSSHPISNGSVRTEESSNCGNSFHFYIPMVDARNDKKSDESDKMDCGDSKAKAKRKDKVSERKSMLHSRTDTSEDEGTTEDLPECLDDRFLPPPQTPFGTTFNSSLAQLRCVRQSSFRCRFDTSASQSVFCF